MSSSPNRGVSSYTGGPLLRLTRGRVRRNGFKRYDAGVKKLPEIGDAFLEIEWEEDDKDTDDYRFLEGLHREGHHPIQVGRSTFVVEQCEDGDPVPHLHATNALRIAVHGVKDMDPSERVYYIWGGRYGIASGGIYESDGTQVRTTPFDRDELVRPRTVLPAVRRLLDGARNKLDHLPCGPDGEFVSDDQYRKLRQSVIDALEALERHVAVRYGR
jgi:hypothetical protein